MSWEFLLFLCIANTDRKYLLVENGFYNHQINGQVITPNSNVFKILDVLRKQETLTGNKFERVNQGKEKKQTTKQQLKL